MLHFCTLCDRKYLEKGLAMYQSLIDHCKQEFKLHWLCIDDQTYRILSDMHLPMVSLHKLSALEDGAAHDDLQQAKSNPATQFGDQYSNYVWSLTPWFINWVMLRQMLPEEVLIYVDSDIFFYRDPALIADWMLKEKKSVAIHTHGFSGNFTDTISTGWYNVGVMVFNNYRTGFQISTAWKDWMINIDHEYYEKYGTCGDQKYLELFVKLWPEAVGIFDTDGGFGHLAPWKTEEKNDVYFFHFSHFTMRGDQWQDHMNEPAEWHPSRAPGMKIFYEQYATQFRQAALKIQVSGRNHRQGSSQNIKVVEVSPNSELTTPVLYVVGCIKLTDDPVRLEYFYACLRSYEFLYQQQGRGVAIQVTIDCDKELLEKISDQVNKICDQWGKEFGIALWPYNPSQSYGQNYLNMLTAVPAHGYVINFMEDQFMVADDLEKIQGLLSMMQKEKVDVCKSTFFKIENESIMYLQWKMATDEFSSYGFIFPNTAAKHERYCSTPYGYRYFIGCNFITTRSFAERYWNRSMGDKPHGYEISAYKQEWEHNCMIPNFEIQCAIDDDHGEPNSCLLKRDEPKFKQLYKPVPVGSPQQSAS